MEKFLVQLSIPAIIVALVIGYAPAFHYLVRWHCYWLPDRCIGNVVVLKCRYRSDGTEICK